MMGFVTLAATANAITDGVRTAQTSRGLPVYWLPGRRTIGSGKHLGKVFIPFTEMTRQTILRAGTTVEQFPEFGTLVAILGGLEARVEVDPVNFVEEEVE